MERNPFEPDSCRVPNNISEYTRSMVDAIEKYGRIRIVNLEDLYTHQRQNLDPYNAYVIGNTVKVWSGSDTTIERVLVRLENNLRMILRTIISSIENDY